MKEILNEGFEKRMRVMLRKDDGTVLEIYTDHKASVVREVLAYRSKRKIRLIKIPSYKLTALLNEKYQNNDLSEEPLTVEVLESILIEAIALNASDIHLYPEETYALIKLRIEGTLQNLTQTDLRQFEAITNRIKVLANLPMASKRTNFDGSFSFKHKGQDYDIRVASLPCVHGEILVLRLFQINAHKLDFKSLNYTAKDIISLENLCKIDHGLIICTGPTGSGKTTCLYALLDKLKENNKSIISIEDPVERKIEGIKQLSLKDNNDMSYKEALSSVLRLDPDILMIGEIRDEETAAKAISLAMTGHLVLTSLHTSDACSAITRLMDLKIPNYLISASLHTIIAHRLIETENKRKPRFEKLTIDPQIKSLIKNNYDEKEVRDYLHHIKHQTIHQLLERSD